MNRWVICALLQMESLRCFFVKKEKEVVVNQVVRSNRSLEICWENDGKQMRSRFYRHADGTWGIDPELAAQPVTIRSLLWTLANAKEIPKKATSRKVVISWE